ncbi:MAG: hypothetical protein NTU98_04460 [Bacteroidetes bacterium]|nr:hypothetical protein [Bacteroidota bacterium]
MKRQGAPDDVLKVDKPPITPIHINRDEESSFLKKIREHKVPDVKPEFLDYSRDLKIIQPEGSGRILYKENTENETFTLTYYYRMGKNHDKVMNFAMGYLPYLGTSLHTADQLKQEFYRLACTFSVNSNDDESKISLTGLSENFSKALALLEEMLVDAQPDRDALSNRVANTLKSRADAKANQNEVFNALVSYGTYGHDSPYKNMLKEDELRMLTAEQLVAKIHDLRNIEHTVLYYGNETPESLTGLLDRYHCVPSPLRPVPDKTFFREKETVANTVIFAPYDARQAKLQTIIKGGKYDTALAPGTALFNTYFGGNIVFQELREKRALAYTATSRYQEPADLGRSYLNMGYIATQSDKVIEAFDAFDELFNAVPESEITFMISKDALLNRISTERLRRMNVLWNFLNAEKLGLNRDIRKEIHDRVTGMTLNDITAFGQSILTGKAKTYLVLGKESEIDFTALAKFGTIIRISLTDLFGY